MKKLFCLLLFASNLTLAQNNVAFLHVDSNSPAPYAASEGAFSESGFDLAGGMVIVKASLNGKEGDFILDTGSPGIVVNSQSDNLVSKRIASGVNGELTIGEVDIDHFQWGMIHRDNMKGFVLNVSHLESACGRDIMGLIGFDVLKNYELVFDYRNKSVKLFEAGKVEMDSNLRPVKSIPFALYGHVPVITAKVGGRRVLLGIDSGAAVNLLDEKYFSRLKDGSLSDVEEEYLTGLENYRMNVIAANVRTTVIKKDTLDEMRFVFTDLAMLQNNFGASIDGLLGYPFFKNQVISINYRKRRIYIWE